MFSFSRRSRKSLEDRRDYSQVCYDSAMRHFDKKDYVQALSSLEMSVKNYDHSDALCKLGEMNLKGIGCTRDPHEALRLLNLSKNSNAKFLIGLIYKNGLGVREDYEEAIIMFGLAAQDGHQEAQEQLSEMIKSSPTSNDPLWEDSGEENFNDSNSPSASPNPVSGNISSGCCKKSCAIL